MIIGILLTILLGGGIAAVGSFLLKYLIFWACAIAIITIIALVVVLSQNYVPRHKNKHRRAGDR
ncbi:MAG: hypothetical protein EOM05_06155 [Clostridia bacterium]|nr:hypothetical protein [Clostridia bacterium]